ncbi:hypothetical protein [Arenimonas composti]|uniref:Uncharacterized protein n=1 Tax=Arenimonas composti TR7-09 = DSM 18010 TaxID=1121013 RepID=A0A091BX39_9GAMM|nr:hypothetical protein [Arenimonas composti]KFN48895.1 hypothetical protein P873_13160 [Arenimonas composti TR7-09 = DSM 18010]
MTRHATRKHAIAATAGTLALAFALPAAAIDPSYSGSWYNPPESGSGFNLEIFSRDRAILYWYTYDDAGEPVWLYSEGVIEGDRDHRPRQRGWHADAAAARVSLSTRSR